MRPFWKQSEVSVTALEHNRFLKARLKLTGLYILIIAVIVFGFSIFLYQSIGHNLKYASDDDFIGAQSHQHFAENTLGSLANDLLMADLVILGLSAGVSFFLAGKTLKPIQQSVEAQKIFTANASHELRTPLAVIRNDIEVFLRSNLHSKEFAQKVMVSNLEEVKRMSDIVNDLLLLARSDHQISQQFKKVDINTVVENTLDRIRALADTRSIRLTYETSGLFIIQGDEDALRRVVLNMVQNSIDHTLPGGLISAKLTKNNGQIVLQITDTGSGISPKDIPHVFKRFYKGDSAFGTGLGLSIVKDIIDQHQGKILVESVEGKGTTFTINLPITK